MSGNELKLIVAVLIGLVFLVLWILKRRNQATGKRALESVTSEMLASADDRDRKVLLELKAGGTAKLRAALARSKQGRWEERAYYVSLAPYVARVELEGWCAREPQSVDALLLRAEHLIAWAWTARGEGRAHDVGGDDWKMYFERLRLARADLEKCIELDHADPTPWGVMLRTVDGEADPEAKIRTYLDKALACDPNGFAALWRAIALLGPRWYGSRESTLGLARQHAHNSSAESGSEHAMLLFRAHFEVWFHLDVFEGNRSATDAWLASNEVRAELDRAYAASLGAPSHRRTRMTSTLRNYAAVTFYRMRDRVRLKRELELLGVAAAGGPWSMLGEGSLEDAQRFAQ